MNAHARWVFVAGLALALAACAAPREEEAQSDGSSAISSPTLDRARVDAAIASLTSVRNGAEIGSYYADGVRAEGCWRNPAGKKLTDLKKAFYCSMPLEFRLCNTIVLLTNDESDVEARRSGYFDCKTKVERVFGGRGLFQFDSNVDDVYGRLYLRGETLSDEDTADVVARNKPAFGSSGFPVLLAEIGASLVREGADMSLDSLASLVEGYKTATMEDPR